MLRPTTRLRLAQAQARPASQTLSAAELGSSRLTRHSFSRSFIRTAARQRWQVTQEVFDIDAQGRGTAVYRIDANGHVFRFVAFSTRLQESERIDRVIAKSWDVTAAMVEGDVTSEQIDRMRAQVSKQEGGRADASTLIWTRANRSARYFDYVVERLAAGEQPEISVIGEAGYLLRSTAFYGNGKWGLADFARYDTGHPFSIPYRGQMLTAWLMREFGYDLVEHCALERSRQAVRLDASWRRYFGLGNATGLGMVPYIINHPQVLDAWVAVRELPLVYALEASSEQGSALTDRVVTLLTRARDYFAERGALVSSPYPAYSEVGSKLNGLLREVEEYQKTGIFHGHPTRSLSRELHEMAAEIGLETRQVVDSILVECSEDLDEEVELLLRRDEDIAPTLGQSCSTFLERLESDYAWAKTFDFGSKNSVHYFWYTSADSEEPRRGIRGVTSGSKVEYPVGIARAIQQLMTELAAFDGNANLAEFLLAHPWQRGWIDRIQGLAGVPYGEVHANLLDKDFIPLDLQRFQLAVYGMENYNPQSTDWLRVVLFGGAPRSVDVNSGIDDDWLFSLKPKEATS